MGMIGRVVMRVAKIGIVFKIMRVTVMEVYLIVVQ